MGVDPSVVLFVILVVCEGLLKVLATAVGVLAEVVHTMDFFVDVVGFLVFAGIVTSGF
jgi:hypothetical protein